MSMIEPKYYTINGLFADRVFCIPHYQRFYSWEKKQREDFFNDLKDLFKKGGDRHHFMATIVCYRTGDKKSIGSVDYNVYDIVDGQQRITTIVLMLKAIHLKLPEGIEKENIGKILVKSDENLLVLQTNNINQDLFNKYLREGIAPKKESIKTHADRNLFYAIKEIDYFIDEWISSSNLMDLLRLIRNRIGFVIYDTDERHAVYTIFESLNSRGLEVDWLDKCKSVLMGIAFEFSQNESVAASRIGELHDLWAKIYNEMALYPIPGHEILRITATIYLGTASGRPLNPEEAVALIREHCSTSQKTIEVTEWLYLVTQKLVQLHKSVFWAPVTRILQARILGVSLLLTDSLTNSEREVALQQWERVSFRIFGLCRKDSRTKVGDYVRLSNCIMRKASFCRNFEEIINVLKLLGKEFPVELAVETLIKEPKYEGFEEECRYLLWQYEEYLAEIDGSEINKELRESIWTARSPSETIEHIFPQNPEPEGPWDDKFDQNEEPDDHIDRIGNLLLLPPRLNSQAGRKSFKDKKEIYKKAEGLRMVREILDCDDWNQAEIEKREGKIAAWIKDAFSDITI
jgi:hypothetical protein